MDIKKHEMAAKKMKDFVRQGHDPKDAMAMALSHCRKMAMGGMVDNDEDEEGYRSQAELQAESVDMPGAMNPEEQDEAMRFAEKLHKKAQMQGMESYAMGGMVEDSDSPMGNKPSEKMEAETSEPMEEEVPGASLAEALSMHKKKRRYT